MYLKQKAAKELAQSRTPYYYKNSLGDNEKVLDAAGALEVMDVLEDAFTEDLMHIYSFKSNLWADSYAANHLLVCPCGHVWNENESKLVARSIKKEYGHRLLSCPECGKTYEWEHTYVNHVLKQFSVVREFNMEEGYAVIRTFMFQGSFEFNREEEKKGANLASKKPSVSCFGWMDSVFGFEFGLLPCKLGLAFGNSGFCCFSYDAWLKRPVLVTRNNSAYQLCVNLVADSIFVGNEQSRLLSDWLGTDPERPGDIMKELVCVSDDIFNKKKKASDKGRDHEAAYRDELEIPEIKTGNFFVFSWDQPEDENHTGFVCSCGCEFVDDDESDEETVCPNCGTKERIYSQYVSSGYKFQRLNDGNVAIMCYTCRGFANQDTHGISYMTEWGILVIDKGKVYPYKTTGILHDWEKCSILDFHWCDEGYRRSSQKCLNSEEELMEIAENSCLKQIGVPDAWKEDTKGSRIDWIGSIARDSYLLRAARLPLIEKVMKVGMITLTRELLHKPSLASDFKKPKAAKLTDVFGVPKQILNLIRSEDMGARQICIVSKLSQADSSFDVQAYKAAMQLASIDWDGSANLSVLSDMANVSAEFGIKVSRMCEYLREVYDDQCIPVAEAVTVWGDWLRMAADLGYNLKKTADKMPDSLRKEHDRAVFAWNAMQKEVIREKFLEAAEKNRKYEWQKGPFEVIVPVSPNEIVAEGVAQRHCVGTYVNGIIEGRTSVVFLRRKDSLDKSYFTVEIREGCITQVKGYRNSGPSSLELIQFIREYARAKGLLIESVDMPTK